MKKKDNKEGDKKEKDDMMDTAKGITGVSSDGATVWIGGVLASQYEENLSKLASDVFSVTIVANDDEEEKDDDEVGRTAEQRWRASDLSKRAAARAVSSCVSRAATL